MCTVTFMPRRAGYCLAMNRDEKRTRQQGLSPSQRNIAGHNGIYPSEPDGGTWIALNEQGVSLALINWYSVVDRAKTDSLSRGKVIPSVVNSSEWKCMQAGLNELLLERINPFRLICVFPSSQEIVEW